MPRKRKRPGVLDEYEVAWIVRQLARATDKPFREIGEEVSNYVVDNEELSDDEYRLGEQIGRTLERLWPTEGYWQRGEDAEEALDVVYRALGMHKNVGVVFVLDQEDDTADDIPTPTCTCGIEIARANDRCPERDCPYARGRS